MEQSSYKKDWEKLIKEECILKGYSNKTIKNYIHHAKSFLASGLPARDYLLSLIKKDMSEQTVRSAGFAIKFYFRLSNKKDSEIDAILKIPNMKKPKSLPKVLSRKEIQEMINSTNNLKHKAIIMTAYSSGLRLSEIINLGWHDIDFERNIIRIKRGKGKKDRIVMLSPKVKKVLKTFNHNSYNIFMSDRGKKYSPGTIELIIQKAAKKAGIEKAVTPHMLRHSFAAHLLENGTDISYIKDSLGHSDISTTLIYTKVSNKYISKIKSPLDY